MNAREGFRRIGLLLGIIGAIVGIAGAWATFNGLIWQHNRNVQFQKDASEYWRVVTKVRSNFDYGKFVDWFRAADAEYQSERQALADIGISNVVIKETHISSFTLTDGTYLIEHPISAFDCLWPLTLPFIGFLVPWGTIKIIFWVISGFTHKTSAAA
jgi:hypothetical protein